jgi:hypothetical protein
MKLAAPFIQLPLLFDAAVLAAEINALGESCWMPHPQGFAGNSMLPLIAVDGEPANESFAGVMRPTPWLLRCRYLMQTLSALGVTLGRTRLMRLSGHAEVTRHADQGYYWADRVRVHIPIVTQPTVRFECGDSFVNMAAGECWIFDTWRQHRVLNDAEDSRIHLVVDTVGGDHFWGLVASGRDHNQRAFSGQWAPRKFDSGNPGEPRLLFESVNVPVVMTPWEIAARIGFLIGDAVAHPALPQLRQAAAQFCRHWQALWAAYGERSEGWPVYRQAIELFMRQINELGKAVILQNELGFDSAMRTLVGKVAVTGDSKGAAVTSDYPSPPVAAPAKPVGPARNDPVFDRPIFVVSSPRSGSTLLFETLAKAPGVYTIGGESHALIEGMAELSPARNQLGSNRLTAAEATPAVSEQLRQRFVAALVDRDGQRPGNGRLRMLEKTPKNSLRVPFLRQVFPEGMFVYLYRDPREVMSSMIEAWQSGRFRTYPDLPGWQGLPWSLLLTPGWQSVSGRSLGEVIAHQWETTTRLLLDDLEAMPRERVVVTRYDHIVADPKREIERVCAAIGLHWDRPIEGSLPLARHTVSQPAPDKWRRHADVIEPQLERLRATIERAQRFVAAEPRPAAATGMMDRG